MSKTNVTFKNDTANKYRVIADKIKAGMTREGTLLSETESHSAYNASLPEGLTPEIIKQVSAHNCNFTKAAHVAVAEMAAEVLVENPELTRVHAKVGFFAPSDNLIFNIDRSREYPVPKAAEGEPLKVTKHLVISCDEDIRGQGLKSLKDSLSNEFKDLFVK